MNTSRKKVRLDLAVAEKKLYLSEERKHIDNKELINIVGGDNIALMTMLLPAFVTGWRMARSKHVFKHLKKLFSLAFQEKLIQSIGL